VDDAGNFTDGLLVEDFFSIYLDPVSVSELSSIQLQAYPNPVLAGDNLNIDFGGIKGTALIEVFANNGALVKSIQVNDVAGAIYQLNTAGMSSGIYMTRIINENQSGVFRFQISE
jgi:hypothetical protein